MRTLLLVVLFAGCSAAQPASNVQTVSKVDLQRYLGDWFEVARLPNEFQEDCRGDVKASYSRREDGRIDVLNRCRESDGSMKDAQGVARVVDETSAAKLEVRFAPAVLSFLPMVWGDYWIIGLADDYSWAVVGSPDRTYLWILARTTALSAAEYERAVAVAARNGFRVEALVKTPHAK